MPFGSLLGKVELDRAQVFGKKGGAWSDANVDQLGSVLTGAVPSSAGIRTLYLRKLVGGFGEERWVTDLS
jgi:hypothetical protein